MTEDRSDEFEETNYKSPLYMVSETHDWSGCGYSYTSETLGVRVEFPPEWEELMTMTEGEWICNGETRPCIDLMGRWDGKDENRYIASIYWRAKTDPYRDFGAFEQNRGHITLAETNEGYYDCCLYGLYPFEHVMAGAPEDKQEERVSTIYNIQMGIQFGEWDLKILQPKP